MSLDRVAVLGAGAWGSALANTAARAGRQVTLWARNPAIAATMARTRESPRLPGMTLADVVTVTGDLEEAAARAQCILLAVPAQELRKVAMLLDDVTPSGTPVIACAKGIERGSHRFMTEVIAECAQTALPAILSGPSFASEVARGMPTAVTIAARDLGLAERLAQAIGSETFRPYHTTDVRGVEIGGAAKNVLAIAAGIVMGAGLGQSATAAITTRGFAELVRFSRAFNANPETMMGLSGLGDLILTCTSPTSRNLTFGINLGRGQAPQHIQDTTGLAEGASTAQVLAEMARSRGVDTPIVNAVADVIEQRKSVGAAIESLLARPFKAEV